MPRARRATRTKTWATLDVTKRAELLIPAVEPLLEFFAEVDAVFSEEALTERQRQVSLGKIYRAWKACRKILDPDFEEAERRRPRKWVPDGRDARNRSES